MKLSDEDVRGLRHAYARGARQTALAREYGLTQGYVSQLLRGVTRAEAGGPMGSRYRERVQPEIAAALRMCQHEGDTVAELSETFGLPDYTVRSVVQGKTHAL